MESMEKLFEMAVQGKPYTVNKSDFTNLNTSTSIKKCVRIDLPQNLINMKDKLECRKSYLNHLLKEVKEVRKEVEELEEQYNIAENEWIFEKTS